MECNVNKEIRDYREGVVMGLSMRQTIWGAVTIVIATATNFVLRPLIGNEPAMMLSILLAAIPGLIGFLKYKGLNFEQFAVAWLRTNFKHSGWYVYRAVSIYDTLRDTSAGNEECGKNNKKEHKHKRKEKNNVKKKKAD